MARRPKLLPMDFVPHEAHCPLAMCSGAKHSLCQCSKDQVAQWSQEAQEHWAHAKKVETA